jgi:hypothetical protein
LERKTCEKRAPKQAFFSRLEKFNALFSRELRAFLIGAQPIRIARCALAQCAPAFTPRGVNRV